MGEERRMATKSRYIKFTILGWVVIYSLLLLRMLSVELQRETSALEEALQMTRGRIDP